MRYTATGMRDSRLLPAPNSGGWPWVSSASEAASVLLGASLVELGSLASPGTSLPSVPSSTGAPLPALPSGSAAAPAPSWGAGLSGALFFPCTWDACANALSSAAFTSATSCCHDKMPIAARATSKTTATVPTFSAMNFRLSFLSMGSLFREKAIPYRTQRFHRAARTQETQLLAQEGNVHFQIVALYFRFRAP